jgi:hypothetical protein
VIASAATNGGIGVIGATAAFVGPTVIVNVATGQRVHITAGGAFGTISPLATGLLVSACYRASPVVMPAPPPIVAVDLLVQTTANNRVTPTLSTTVTGLVPGNYEFGCCAYSSDVNWNSNDFSFVSVLVFQP